MGTLLLRIDMVLVELACCEESDVFLRFCGELLNSMYGYIFGFFVCRKLVSRNAALGQNFVSTYLIRVGLVRILKEACGMTYLLREEVKGVYYG